MDSVYRRRAPDHGGIPLIRKSPSLRMMFLVLGTLLLVVPTAFAAKGGNGGARSNKDPVAGGFELRLVTDRNGDRLPNWNDEITFDVTTDAVWPMVNVTCYQGETLVKNQNVGFYLAWPASNRTFTLSDWYTWSGGGADCTARLYAQTTKGEVTLDTLGFRVYD
jgi:hypothetical protein